MKIVEMDVDGTDICRIRPSHINHFDETLSERSVHAWCWLHRAFESLTTNRQDQCVIDSENGGALNTKGQGTGITIDICMVLRPSPPLSEERGMLAHGFVIQLTQASFPPRSAKSSQCIFLTAARRIAHRFHESSQFIATSSQSPYILILSCIPSDIHVEQYAQATAEVAYSRIIMHRRTLL